ncbi:protein zyg-11 homolog B-like [Uloborus diversus]|uniref:protein zyg-11 homolog B-like n=1 Tax=Uloborus diversus TaxID=327109 RepID=UPI00240956F3|nr:protein zyg-11 homolog B-like [Uloborus diversus]
MYESPELLQDLCIAYISRNIDSIFHVERDFSGNILKYSLQNQGICFPSCVSEQLFAALDEKNLTDQLLTIFDPSVTRLQRVHISDASEVSCKGLRVLRQHKITELVVTGLSSITVNDLIGCLGDWTLEHLRLLNVSNSSLLSSEKVRVIIALSKLRNLRCLDVSFTEFNTQGLIIVAEDLPALESLNISGTMVTDISPLKKCKERLKYLNMYNLRLQHSSKFLPILTELHNLHHLDISEDNLDYYELNSAISTAFCEFLKKPSLLPHLVSLDISGKYGVDAETVKIFLKNHPNMLFLGLLETEICHDDIFCKESNPFYNPNLIVTGYALEKQVLEALRRYVKRKFYIQKALCNLYSYIQNLTDVRLDIIKLVLRTMKTYPDVLGIQMAATACLYNLTKGGLSSRIHTNYLKQIVDLILLSMETFPKMQQLQKNTLLTLCSDRMLQDVTFDRYHCAELVMNSLMAFDDPAMNRMSVAICSILAARISTAETSNLGAKFSYMRRLLSIIRTKMDQGEVDIMMKFTLSALWNLTDESPKTCSVFLKLGGMQLFLDVLNKFAGESAVETKVLGLMNNIAEVAELRHNLMHEDFVTALKKLLRSDHIDVSYFAAGIVAHIASEGKSFWDCSSVSWNDMISELGDAVLSWHVPETEMVAYRSFNPFYPLFSTSRPYQVQLWAVWAVHHVCSKNRKFCQVLSS